MGALKAFLQESPAGQTREVIVSERFKGEDGKAVPFTIQTISQEENEQLARMSRKNPNPKGAGHLDELLYTKRLMLACVQEPDLKNSELCKYYGTENPLDVLSKMLSVGEYNFLSNAIMEINGMNDVQEKLKEAKNF